MEYKLCKMLKRTPSEIQDEPSLGLFKLYIVHDQVMVHKLQELKEDYKRVKSDPFAIYELLLREIVETITDG